METCLEHLKKYDGAVVDLVAGNESLHRRVDKRALEVASLKGRVLELETRNVLLEAKVTHFSLSVKREETDHLIGGLINHSCSLDAG